MGRKGSVSIPPISAEETFILLILGHSLPYNQSSHKTFLPLQDKLWVSSGPWLECKRSEAAISKPLQWVNALLDSGAAPSTFPSQPVPFIVTIYLS